MGHFSTFWCPREHYIPNTSCINVAACLFELYIPIHCYQTLSRAKDLTLCAWYRIFRAPLKSKSAFFSFWSGNFFWSEEIHFFLQITLIHIKWDQKNFSRGDIEDSRKKCMGHPHPYVILRNFLITQNIKFVRCICQ